MGLQHVVLAGADEKPAAQRFMTRNKAPVHLFSDFLDLCRGGGPCCVHPGKFCDAPPAAAEAGEPPDFFFMGS
eukprot:7640840-Alexandrium_andersonii.AAC.1